MIDNNFRFSDSSIPQGYQLEHALSVFQLLEKRAASVDYAVWFSSSMEFLPKENALAVYYLLKRGNDSDKIRALRYISGTFCVRIDRNFSKLLAELLTARDSSMPVRDAAIAAFIKAIELDGSSPSEAVRNLHFTSTMLETFVVQAPNYANVMAFIERLFEREPTPLFRDELSDSLEDATLEGSLLFQIANQQAWSSSQRLQESLPRWFGHFANEKQNMAALLVALAIERAGGEVASEQIEPLIPESVAQWTEDGDLQRLIIMVIARKQLRRFVPSLLAGLASGTNEKFPFASALIELDQSAEDMADVIVNGIRKNNDAAIAEGKRILPLFSADRENPRGSPEQQFAMRAIDKALNAPAATKKS